MSFNAGIILLSLMISKLKYLFKILIHFITYILYMLVLNLALSVVADGDLYDEPSLASEERIEEERSRVVRTVKLATGKQVETHPTRKRRDVVCRLCTSFLLF